MITLSNKKVLSILDSDRKRTLTISALNLMKEGVARDQPIIYKTKTLKVL